MIKMIMTEALIEAERLNISCTRVLLRPMVFLHVCYSNLILLIKLFVVAYPTVFAIIITMV
jgi:hypothetical protein